MCHITGIFKKKKISWKLVAKIYCTYKYTFTCTVLPRLLRSCCKYTSCEVEGNRSSFRNIFLTYLLPGSLCDLPYGCPDPFAALDILRCACYRDCPSNQTSVCGSDGRVYKGRCELEVMACHTGRVVEVRPRDSCHGSLAVRH